MEQAVEGAEVFPPDPTGTGAGVLSAALKLLALHGEAGIRVSGVADLAGVSVGTIYTHFESRDGLIEACFAAQYRNHTGDDLMPLHRVMGENCSRDDIVTSLRDSARLDAADDPELLQLAASRLSRAEAVGASRRRPGLAREIELENSRIRDIEVLAARQGQELGLLNPNLDPEALVTLVQVFLFGLALVDSSNLVDSLQSEWERVVNDFAQTFLSDPAP